jgi:hypothetical protein
VVTGTALLLLALQAAGVTVSGRVLDGSGSLPVGGAVVEASGQRAHTDTSGSFTFTLPTGRHVLTVAATRYRPDTFTVEVGPAGLSGLELKLAEAPRLAESVEVTAPLDPTGPAALPVRPTAVLNVAGGLDNVFRVLHTLPGVAATEEFGSRLSVRGGGPDQNLTIMDGVEIHNPYRLFGLTSAFNPETVSSFELTAGAFSAKYGDRLSSLLLIENRPGDAGRRLGGTSALSVTDGNVIVEGRLPGRPAGSWLLTGRRTYYDLVAERFIDADLPSFNDVQLKVDSPLGESGQVSLFALRSREDTDVNFEDDDLPQERGVFLANVRNEVASTSFRRRLGGRGTSRTVLAFYRNTELLDADVTFVDESRRSNTPSDDALTFVDIAFDRTVTVRDWSLRQEVAWPWGSHLPEAGFEVHRLNTAVHYEISGERNPTAANGSSVQGGAGLPDRLDSSRESTRVGAWLADQFHAGRLSLEPGLRLDGSGVNGRVTLSPRLAGTFRLNPHTRVRLALGRHTQSPGYEKLLQSDYFLDLTEVGRVRLLSERSDQVLLALERDLPRGLTGKLEGYVKGFDRLIIGRLETEAERQARLLEYDFPASLADHLPTEPIITTTPTNDGRGIAYGFDAYLARPATATTRMSGWASYTFGIARREAYGREYAFEYDRRHALSVVAVLRPRAWLDVSATFRAASGFPRTPVAGLRVPGAADVLDADGDGNREELVPRRDSAGRLVYTTHLGGVSNINTARLPTFARLDLRATFHPGGAGGRWQLYLDVLNALNRKNAGFIGSTLEYDPTSDRPRIVEEPDGNIPFLPSIGVRFRF